VITAQKSLTPFLCLFLILTASVVMANDGIYPPSPTAAKSINFDGRGFIINGKRTFIASGGMEYARVPRALWRDRLLKMKRAGINCTELYVFWNFHEPKEGQWDFSGDHDLNAYLKLVKELGMYAIVRVGPYVCAEWDSGGYPVWLRFKPGVEVREDNPQFLEESYRYFDKVIPIVVSNQISRGGAVIMVQIENEDSDGWGTEHNLYEEKLRDKALALGIDVPTFFSGLHHSSDPAGDTPWGDVGRTNPWLSTEFYSDWYNVYGAQDSTSETRSTWKIIAFGGNGYNYYMFHGGTNFETYNDDEVASSYDYGAPIGQAGDLRPSYYKFKEVAMFAHTFESILENSDNTSSLYAGIAANPAIKVYARTGPDGTIVFLDNPTQSKLYTKVTGTLNAVEPAATPALIEPQMMLPVVQNFAVTPDFALVQSTTQILTSVRNGNNTTLVVYGQPGASGSVELSEISKPLVHQSSFDTLPYAVQSDGLIRWNSKDSHSGTVNIVYPVSGAASIILSDGVEKLQILALSEDLADRTWPIDTAGGTDIVIGPDYVGDYRQRNNANVYEAYFTQARPKSVWEIKPDLAMVVLQTDANSTVMPNAPNLTGWKQKTVEECNPSYNVNRWISANNPPVMGADGDDSAYAWYLTDITTQLLDTQYLVPTSVADRMILFVDGKRQQSGFSDNEYRLSLSHGHHDVTILTTHYGRNKLVGYRGPIDTIDAKGIVGEVALADRPMIPLTQWQALPAVQTEPDQNSVPTTGNVSWKPFAIDDDLFNRQVGWDWCETVIPASSDAALPMKVTVHFTAVDDNATIFCNGVRVGGHQGWNTPFDLDLTAAWKSNQKNVITVLVENTAGPGGITGSVALWAPTQFAVLHNWRMRGGIGLPGESTDWSPLTPVNNSPPAFFQAKFIDTPPAATGPYPILRVRLGGMSAGFVWLNGHNLGRYPEKIPVDGLYLPECWILPGENTLTIFDEDGKQPTDVSLYTEMSAGRYGFILKR
jgi:beta-galactosidase